MGHKTTTPHELYAKNSTDAVLAACRTKEIVEFAIPDVNKLQICPDRSTGLITIKYDNVCKQTLRLGDIRKWMVYVNAGQLYFRDEPSTLLALGYGLPVISAPFTGKYGHHLAFKGVSTNACPFTLIGTDDYRDLNFFTLNLNIYNVAITDKNYIDIQIYTYTQSRQVLYGAYIKHSKYDLEEFPPACTDEICDQYVCLTAGLNMAPCQ